jgi:hypothetical protein
MKSKKSSGDFQENDAFRGKRKHKLAPVKKQKSQKPQFLDEIEDFDDDVLDYKAEDLDDLYEDLDDFADEDDEDDEEDD